MKLYLNTSVLPFFCAFDDESISPISWKEGREAGKKIHTFFRENFSAVQEIREIYIVNGPGGFSDLRLASMIAQIFQQFFQAKIFTISGEDWICHFLTTQKFSGDFVLNSFGNKVWHCQKNRENLFVPLGDIKNTDNIWIAVLPPAKQSLLPLGKNMPSWNDLKIVIKSLMSSPFTLTKKITPDYRFDGV